MRVNRILLCTDMDRTIIPNGHQPEHPKARKFFRQLCNLPDIDLVYVTGRHLQLVEEAIEVYSLPEPSYVIADVGTKIYHKVKSKWHEMDQWHEQIARDWQGKTHAQLQNALQEIPNIDLQEESKQSDCKLSYYLPLTADHNKISCEVEKELIRLGVAASLIVSIDEPEEIALLDILPQHATKLHAILFLQKQLGFDLPNTFFSGDSGNDLLVLGSEVPSILVANAHKDIQAQAVQLAKDNGNAEALYLAKEDFFSLGGNYSAGVIQGIAHYLPEIVERLDLLTPVNGK